MRLFHHSMVVAVLLATSAAVRAADVDRAGAAGPEARPATSANVSSAAPLMSISSGSVTEGGKLEYVVALSAASDSEVRTDFTVERRWSSATDGVGKDFMFKSGSITFEPGDTRKTIEIQTHDDRESELDEYVTVSLEGPAGATFKVGYSANSYRSCGDAGTCLSHLCCACGWILDNEPPAIRVSDARGIESAGSLSFRLDLNKSPRSAASVKFSTRDGTAKSGEDYTATSKTVEFGAGDTRKTVAVPMTSDDSAEPDERFTVHLSEAAGLAVLDGEGTGTIVDDDALPTVSISDARARESAGKLEFPVTLSNPFRSAVSVDFSTSDGTAVAGEDYTGTTETVEFDAGQTKRTVAVPVADDGEVEPDETLTASLSNPTGATILDGEAAGTIVNDDLPLLTVRGSSAPEGEMLEYAVTLNAPSEESVTVSCRSRYNPFPDLRNPRAYRLARAGEDYVEHYGEVIVFAPGETRKTFGVRTLDDQTDEPDEAVIGDCWNAKNAAFATGAGSAACPWRTCGARGCADCSTITDNDADAEISLSDISVSESAGVATVSGKLSVRSERRILVNWGTRPGTAESGKDFEPKGSLKSFSPWWNLGLHGVSFQVPIIDDDRAEPDETVHRLGDRPRRGCRSPTARRR